jgi:murein L,D-transpeptidase YcbB/YkuD
MKTKFFKTNFLSLSILSIFSVAPLLFSGMSANAQATSGEMNRQPNQTAPGVVPFEELPSVVPSQSAPRVETPQSLPGVVPYQAAPGVTSSQALTLGNYSPRTAPMLATGNQGNIVRDVQSFLKARGLYTGQIDGIYGPQTQAAVRRFQQRRDLAADGIVGFRTWGAMINQAQP